MILIDSVFGDSKIRLKKRENNFSVKFSVKMNDFSIFSSKIFQIKKNIELRTQKNKLFKKKSRYVHFQLIFQVLIKF